ncbi:MAG: phosphatase PAP2-related protein [Candidatus Taylorbacteria bacterium]|nr:phosphatase PAP2-related protein [Candidatus Taylorbacteria bacterium]
MNIIETYKQQFSDRKLVYSMVISFVMLFFSFLVNYLSSLYAYERASNFVDDIVLSNMPTYNVDWVFVWGPIIFWVVLAYFLLKDPKKLPFTLKTVSLFVVIRAFFVIMTHLGPPPDHSPLTVFGTNWVADFLGTNPVFSFIFSSGADLFFSGHTGLPFILALVFWEMKGLRVFCLATSVFFGIIVLLGHLHYTIDVASAFFITFAIYHIATHIFKTDKEMFLGYNSMHEHSQTIQ